MVVQVDDRNSVVGCDLNSRPHLVPADDYLEAAVGKYAGWVVGIQGCSLAVAEVWLLRDFAAVEAERRTVAASGPTTIRGDAEAPPSSPSRPQNLH
jgi:hypothetical protein